MPSPVSTPHLLPNIQDPYFASNFRPQANMIATKRRREDSITSTSTASQLPGSHTPSLPPSTPVPLSRNARYPEQRPKNRASLHRLGNRQQSSTPSTQFSAHRGQIARRTTAPSIPKNQTAREGNTGSSEENDSLDEIIMAVDLKGRGSVGCCYYVAREEKVIGEPSSSPAYLTCFEVVCYRGRQVRWARGHKHL